MAVVVGGLQDVESMVALKDFMNAMGCENLFTEERFPECGSGTDIRSSYIFNSTILGIEVRSYHFIIMYIYIYTHTRMLMLSYWLVLIQDLKLHLSILVLERGILWFML